MKLVAFALLILLPISSLVYKSDASISNFETDNLNNLYLLQDDRISLIDKSGKKLFEFSDQRLGSISSMHQTSGLRTILFYKDQSTFLVLDNTLSLQNPAVRLSNFGYNYISLMCTSENNSYWCYSEESRILIRLNQQLRQIGKSTNIEMTTGKSCSPTQMIERNANLFVNDPANGIHVFDNFGNYEKTIEIKNCTDIDIVEDDLFYIVEGQLWKYNMISFVEERVLENENKIDNFSIESNDIFFQIKNEIFKEAK